MLEGTNKIFSNAYEEFKSEMIKAAENDELPVLLQLDDVKDLTLKDIHEMFFEFNRDTSFDIEGHVFICSDCKRLHLVIEVDYPEAETTIIQ